MNRPQATPKRTKVTVAGPSGEYLTVQHGPKSYNAYEENEWECEPFYRQNAVDNTDPDF